MNERKFQGMLNTKSVYGQSYGNYASIRFGKLSRLNGMRSAYNNLWLKWNKRTKFIKPSWSKQLWNWYGEIVWTQRQENHYRNRKQIKLMRWRKK